MHHLRNRRRFWIISTVVLASGVFVLLTSSVALAQQPPGPLPTPGEVGLQGAAAVPGQAGLALPTTDPRIIVAKIIRVALSFLGIVALVLIIYGGFLWMTSEGNEEQLDKARKVIINAAIGLAIILSALAITQFILNKLLADQARPPLPPPSAALPRVGGGALGSGIVESHYPMRGASNVPRNTRVVVTFKEKIDPTSVPESVKIIKTADIDDTVRGSPAEKYVDFIIANTEDLRTFVFTPVEHSERTRRALLGSATDNADYTVYLCGTASSPKNCAAGGIKLLGGQSAFVGHFKDYQWSFEVGTFLDVTPPQLQSVIPTPDNAPDVGTGNCPGTAHDAPCDRPDRPRNSMVQLNFSEAVLPTVASGTTLIQAPAAANAQVPTRGSTLQPGTYDELRVRVGTDFLAGAWQIGNQYQTAEFVSAELCARNSCGEDVFCLPKQSGIAVEVLAASLTQPNDPSSAGRFDGIEDIAGNSLDGNKDGRAQGPVAFFNRNTGTPGAVNASGDNERFSFFTSDEILLGSPIIEETTPKVTYGEATAGVPLGLDHLEMIFNRALALTTFTSKNVQMAGQDRKTGGIWDTWWTTAGVNRDEDAIHPYGQGVGQIRHGGLWEETNYLSAVTQAVRDLFQNCYYPGGGKRTDPDTGTTVFNCAPNAEQPYCCNGVAGVACAAGDVNCRECGF